MITRMDRLTRWVDAHLFPIVLGGIGMGMAAAILLVVVMHQQWDRYRLTHHCQPTGASRPGAPTYVLVGQVLIPIPTTEREWACDNEEHRWQ